MKRTVPQEVQILSFLDCLRGDDVMKRKCLDHSAATHRSCRHSLWDSGQPLSSIGNAFTASRQNCAVFLFHCRKCSSTIVRSPSLIRIHWLCYGTIRGYWIAFVQVLAYRILAQGLHATLSSTVTISMLLYGMLLTCLMRLIAAIATLVIHWESSPNLEYTNVFIKYIETEREIFEKGASKGTNINLLLWLIMALIYLISLRIGA